MTYDEHPRILDLYNNCRITKYQLVYSAGESRQGAELLISSGGLQLPREKLWLWKFLKSAYQIQYWGNQESRRGRKSYGKIREYMFVALVAKSNIDFVELDKGNISKSKAVDTLIQTMEEYANYGFFYMEDKLTDNPDYFFRKSAFLDLFLNFLVEESGQGGQKVGWNPYNYLIYISLQRLLLIC